MILWIVDRFGMPGAYHRTWSKMLRDAGLDGKNARIISLHSILKRTLLMKYKNRKAPTWITAEATSITNAIDLAIKHYSAQAVVLASPESLACLGLDPEHATLHNLRGSVYWRDGVPHIVMLPMSAWFSLVSQKDIGASNYGFETAEKFAEGRTGSVHQKTQPGDTRSDGHAARVGYRPGADGARSSQDAGRASDSSALPSGRSDPDDSASRVRGQVTGGGADSSSDTAVPSQLPAAGSRIRDGGVAGGSGEGGTDAGSPHETPHSDQQEHGQSFDPAADPGRRDSPPLHHDHGDVAGGGEQLDDSDSDADEDISDDETSGEDESTDSDDSGQHEGEDSFFYEPVLSPVGRFVLTADTMKLQRLIEHGINSPGLAKPITLDWS